MHRPFTQENWGGLLASAVLAFAVGCGGADGANNGGAGGNGGTIGSGGTGSGGTAGTAGTGGTGSGGTTGTGGTGSGGTAGTGGGSGGTGVIYPPGCTYQGVEITRQSVSEQPTYFSYSAVSGTQAPFDVVYLQSYQGAPYNGPTTPGTYDLSGTNYQDCGLCLLAKRGCGSDGNCDQTFYADIGQVRIDAIGEVDFKLKATLINVIFREVTINATTFRSYPVAGGDLWCAYETDLEVMRVPTQPACVEEGTGVELGENIANFGLQQCSTGDYVNLHRLCNKEKAIWAMAVTGW